MALSALLCAGALGGLAVPARADLVVLEDGRVVKVASYRVHEAEGQLEVGLPGGGGYRIDLDRVERIVEDEVVVSEVVVDTPPEPAGVLYDLSWKADRKALYGSPYDAIIEREAKAQNVDAALISAVIRAESGYQPRAVSRKGARGLMQLMPATARRLDVRRPFDPSSNIRGGTKYLRLLAERFGHRPELVLAAYNAGEGAVDTYGGVPPYKETLGYVKKIMTWWTPAVAEADAASATEPATKTAGGR
ncbi:MAG TPA: lytic transglycosylase domain-containing protein [Thermoanaerobaculia bacterium]|jgi:hypothetical protein